ncbi:unnamed protein product [Caenorhabditis brenneri]
MIHLLRIGSCVFGEPMRRVLPVAEEAVGAHTTGSDNDDQPPIIPRYDPANSDTQRLNQPARQVYTGQQVIRTMQNSSGNKGNVIYLKSTDGATQKMMVRQSGKPDQSSYRSQDHVPGAVLPGGSRVVAVRSAGAPHTQQVRQMYASGSAPRYVRVQNTAGSQFQRPMEQINRRIVHTGQQRRMEFTDHDQGTNTQSQSLQQQTQHTRYVLQGAVSQPVNSTKTPRAVLPRGGMTMQMMQQAQHSDHRRLISSGRQKQKVTTYRDFMASRGYLDASKFMYGKIQTKPTFLPFEFNEEEEREINEAIAREEEWMRLEEENKISAYDSAGNPIRTFTPSSDVNRAPPYVSNLLPSVDDTSDDKVIKQVLDVMFSQVCRWDRQYGWSKTHMKRARQKNDNEKVHLRKVRMTQREVLISEHMERLKKEINKRRTKMENEAEQQCGLLTPWRKSRTRPNRSAKPKSEVKKEVINPADITLGGDTYDYRDQKPLDSIAINVSRRRRTSATLSKSEDEDEKKLHISATTRCAKGRRTSEPTPRVTFYAPGLSSADIDVAIPHCICQQLFDSSKLYVSCDMCGRWYHGECVNVTEKMCAKLEQWTCDQCTEEQERVKEQPALYCVCKKPYDDTKFYVGCDSCQGWFHPECVGTTRADAEQAAEYNCPNCLADSMGYESEGSEASVSSLFNVHLTRGDYSFVMELLELLLEHRMSTPFRNPIDCNECPDYDKVIKKPMDLTTISRKVEQTEYLFLGEFVNDVNLMFENAKTYNPKDNAVFKCAETMQEVFDKKLYDVREIMRAHQQVLLFQQQQQHNPISSARKRVQSESQKTTDSLDIDSDQLLPLDANLMSQLFDY